MKSYLLLSSVIVVTFSLGCTSASESNTAADANTNIMVNVDANTLPPEFSTKPIEPSGESTPGIPAPGQANVNVKGATPTPGIPDPANAGKQIKPGATPTPGIPDQETLRRQMQRPANVNSAPNLDTVPNERKRPRPVGNSN